MRLDKKIVIGVCTYKRPVMLQRCLLSLSEMFVPDNAEVVIAIADNDPDASAKDVVESFNQNNGLLLSYDIETKPGIPFARNNVLNQCNALEASELAFIDDDEYVDKKWLLSLWNYYQTHNVDVVRGNVFTVYDEGTPKWVSKSGVYQRKKLKHGAICKSAATNNVLFNYKKLVIEMGIKFDENFGLTGGSDTDFFNRAFSKGCIIHSVEDALVYEELESHRKSFSYFVKRRFRASNSKTQFQNIGIGGRLYKLFVSFAYLGFVILTFPVNTLRLNYKVVYNLGYLITAVAKFLGVFGIHPKWKEYGD